MFDSISDINRTHFLTLSVVRADLKGETARMTNFSQFLKNGYLIQKKSQVGTKYLKTRKNREVSMYKQTTVFIFNTISMTSTFLTHTHGKSNFVSMLEIIKFQGHFWPPSIDLFIRTNRTFSVLWLAGFFAGPPRSKRTPDKVSSKSSFVIASHAPFTLIRN